MRRRVLAGPSLILALKLVLLRGGRNPAITPLEWEAPVKRSTLAGASFLAGAALLGGFLDLGVGKGRMPTGA